MAQETNVLKFGDVVERVRAYQTKMAAEKEAGATKIPETDPAEKGVCSIPTDPEASKSKQNLPQDNTNASYGENNLEHRDTHPHATGKYRTSVANGVIKDEAAEGSDPTKPLSKIANRAQAIMSRIQATGASPETPETPEAKSASGGSNTDLARDMQPDPEFLFKLASTIIETEGGLQAVEPVLRKAAGIEAAQELITKAASAYDALVQEGYEQMEMEKEAAAQVAQYQNAVAEEIGEMFKNASEEEKAAFVNLAQVHDANIEAYEYDLLKQAYMAGAEDAAGMEDSMIPEEAGAEMLPPEAAELPGAEGPAGPEEIIMLLQQLVESGEIDEETALAVAEEIAGGGAGGEAGLEEEIPEDVMVPEGADEEMIAEASVKQAALLARELVR